MNSYAYKKIKKKNFRKIFRLISLIIFFLGLMIIFYVSYPLLSWQVYFAPVFTSADIKSPIPKKAQVNSSTIKSLLVASANSIKGTDYTNAQNWFPNFNPPESQQRKVTAYMLSIPKLKIKNAIVSTIDNDLGIHLVNYAGTAIPPEKGNAVVFGHSTLPQLFNSKDYKTIFATLHTLKIDDEIYVDIDNLLYFYKIDNIIVVDPNDNSIFSQNYNDSYLTLVTCTPPGTTWKRLIIRAKLQKI